MQQDTRQDVAGQPLPLVDAAARLGLTPEALRKRLQRGSLDGYKRDGQWYAWLPGAVAGRQDAAGHDGLPRQDTPPAAVQTRQDSHQDTAAVAAAITSELDTLKSEVSFLRDELRRRDEAHAVEIQRRDESAEREREQHAQEREALHARLHEALTALALARALPSGAAERATAQAFEAAAPAPRPWWAFWRRSGA